MATINGVEIEMSDEEKEVLNKFHAKISQENFDKGNREIMRAWHETQWRKARNRRKALRKKLR